MEVGVMPPTLTRRKPVVPPKKTEQVKPNLSVVHEKIPDQCELTIRFLDGLSKPFRNYVSHRIEGSLLVIECAPYDVTERVGNRSVEVTGRITVMFPVSRILQVELKTITQKVK